MRILVIPGTFNCKNLGDVAMLQVAVERVARAAPRSTISVLTYEPEALRKFCPEVEPVCLRGWDRWREAKLLPRWLCPKSERRLRRNRAALFRRLWSLKATIVRGKYLAGLRFLEELDRTDAVFMAGCGILNDCFLQASLQALDLLELALDRGLFTALFSQGIGPMHDAMLHRRAGQVLPRIHSTFIREERTTRALLDSLHVPPNRIAFTGDDAVEIAWKAHKNDLGRNIGFNLRVSRYSGISDATVHSLREVLVQVAKSRDASLLGVPIARGSADCDVATARRILGGLDAPNDPGADTDTPFKVVQRISECRVVVTGSYHVAVFALAQGIPAVCVAGNRYYGDKFLGLADKFGRGCVVLAANHVDFEQLLSETIDHLWKEAPGLRNPLLQEAEREVKLGETAYTRLISQLARQGDTSVSRTPAVGAYR